MYLLTCSFTVNQLMTNSKYRNVIFQFSVISYVSFIYFCCCILLCIKERLMSSKKMKYNKKRTHTVLQSDQSLDNVNKFPKINRMFFS